MGWWVGGRGVCKVTSTTILLFSLKVVKGVGCKPANTTSLEWSLGLRMGGSKVDWF